MRYFLTGMPGSGKSYWGKQLEEKYNLPFLDLDDCIEAKEAKSITDIFRESGEAYFRKLESQVLQELIAENEQLILACGGGTPCFHNNMEVMNKSGITIFLNSAPDSIISNLGSSTEIEQRPLFKGLKSSMEVNSHLQQLLSQRIKYYKKARYEIIAGDFKKTQKAFDEIFRLK